MRVLVLGAGYAGLTLARDLERRLPADADLTVVNDSPHHLVQHEVHRAIRRPAVADAIQVAQVGPSIFRGKAAKAMKATVGAGHLTSVGAISRAVDLVDEELHA